MDSPSQNDYRKALQLAERALMHAEKLGCPQEVHDLIQQARFEVSRVLDIGRDDADEMVLT